MLHRTMAALCAAVVLSAVAQEHSSAPDPKYSLQDRALVSALRSGGYTLYFRHAATDFSQNDVQKGGYDDCAKQWKALAAGNP